MRINNAEQGQHVLEIRRAVSYAREHLSELEIMQVLAQAIEELAKQLAERGH